LRKAEEEYPCKVQNFMLLSSLKDKKEENEQKRRGGKPKDS
jgi:hypothetical protein